MLRDCWISLIKKVVLGIPASHCEFSGHKFVDNLSYTIEGKDWMNPDSGFDIPELGYASRKAKFSQLSRIYYSQENIDKSKEKLKDREEKDFTSVGVSMLAGNKDSRSQGHCMINIVVSKILSKSETNVSIFYRNTELIRKFGADLIFLKDVVLPEILGDEPIHKVTFHFANAYFSPMFLPVIIPYIEDIPEFLAQVKEFNEHNVWRTCVWSLKIPILKPDPNHYNYRSRRNMHQIGINHYKNLDPKHLQRIIKYLKEVGEWKGGIADE